MDRKVTPPAPSRCFSAGRIPKRWIQDIELIRKIADRIFHGKVTNKRDNTEGDDIRFSDAELFVTRRIAPAVRTRVDRR